MKMRLNWFMIKMLCGGFLFFTPLTTFATGILTPWVDFSDSLTPASTVSGIATIGRASGEVGALSYSIEYSGDCVVTCLSGATFVVMQANQNSLNYAFTLTPGNLATGSYREYITFISQGTLSDPGVLGSSVVQGASVIVRFSVVNTTTASSGGSGGGGGRSSVSIIPTTVAAPTSQLTLPVTTISPMPSTTIAEPSSSSFVPESIPPSPDVSIPASIPITQPAPVFSYDYNTDSFKNSSDVLGVMSDYLAGNCTSACDVDGDGKINLKDLVAFAKHFHMNFSEKTVSPSTPFGPPLLTDDVILYSQKATEQGAYQFMLTSTSSQNDMLAFSLFVDTGPSGILAVDTMLHFDPMMLQFIGSSAVSSIFPVTDSFVGDSSRGFIHVIGISATPFIGTRGHIATLYFRPLQTGVAGVSFATADIYRGEGIKNSVTTKDAMGKLMIPVFSPVVFETPALPSSSCGCLRSDRFRLCFMLLLACSATVLSVVVLFMIRYTRKKIL